MSEQQPPAGRDERYAPSGNRRPTLLVLLVAVLWLECALLAAITVYLVVELLVATPDSYASAIALAILAALATVWLGVLALQCLHGRSWTRAGVVVWQLLQIAVAVSSFQGLFARADVGWALLVPAVLALVLLFTPPVIDATTGRKD
ncbi:MAG: hypothetical protein ABI400_03725 [Lacisediminihabitans sp.]